MTTEVFKSYDDFLSRTDKSVNGVTAEFLAANPTATDERDNRGCWNCSDCYRCSHCSHCSDCYRCSHCYHCSDCYRCYRCSDCYRCSHCSDIVARKAVDNGKMEIPVIENIHRKILEAASATPNSFEMGNWHTCDTTHCRGGWAVFLAGEAGKRLEEQTSTLFAAMQIYKASSPIRVWPPRFFESNEVAMADMKRCADEEAKLNPAI